MPALHHVQLAMPLGREDEARAFYLDVLGPVGLAEIAKPSELRARGGVWFRSGALELHLGVEDDFAPARKAHPGILLDEPAELDALAARLAAAGTTVQQDDTFPGYRRFHVRDCFGNRLEFMAAAGGRPVVRSGA